MAKSEQKELKQILLVYEDGNVTSMETGFAGGLGEDGERLHMIFAGMSGEDILRVVYALGSFVSNTLARFEEIQAQEEEDGGTQTDRD